ncbi:MAG: hypothetical protein K8R87_03490 [Verrucomicrobia bacterium]|nr:hypothetical protein [Verrucomicrobiota bacterium]
MRLFFLGCVLLTGCLTSSLQAAGKNIPIPTDPTSGITIEIASWLDACPPGGMASFTLKITNGSNAAHDWNVTATDPYNSGTTSTFSVSVPAGRTAEVPFTVATGLRDSGSSNYRMLNFTVTGHGSVGSSGQFQQPDSLSKYSHSSATPFLAMSSQLALKGWSALNDKFEKAATAGGGGSSSSGIGFDATQVDMAKAPEDWRGYSGIAQLWMTDGEWSAMGSGAKAAMLEWVALGGRIILFGDDLSDATLTGLKVPPLGPDGVRRIGAGRILTQNWLQKTFPVADAYKLTTSLSDDSMPKQLAKYGSAAWKLRDAVAAPSLRALLIFGFIVVFGILVGPVNLYWLAGAKRRQRLFWTTPLISLAGSALLVALMIMQDVIGGSGARRVLALMLPEQNKIALVQEQISRTGVLLGRSFAIEEPSWMQQVSADTTSSSAYNPRGEMGRQFRESDQLTRSGDWFNNRAVQAQVINAVRPSRGHIEVFPGSGVDDPPSVVSSLGVTLTNVFIIDDQRRCWRAEQIGTGERKITKSCTHGEFKSWIQSVAFNEMGPASSAALNNLNLLPGHAYAESAEASKFAVKTLDSIRWNDERVIFAGPYVKH